jgi:GntR family transcriptional regulator
MSAPDIPNSRHGVIAATLRAEIQSGALAPGSALASEAELSDRFSVSRGTVRQALAALRAEGLITGGRGRQPVVTRPTLAQSFNEMISFSAWAEQLGRVPGARTLELTRRPADSEVARQLGLEPGTNVVQYRRLRLLDGTPAMIELSTFIEPVGRLLFDCDLDNGSVYAQLAERGVAFAEAQQAIAAIAAGAEHAALLGVSRRAPLLEVRRRMFDPSGSPLEWSIDSYRGDAFAVTIHNRLALPRAGVGLTLVGRRRR